MQLWRWQPCPGAPGGDPCQRLGQMVRGSAGLPGLLGSLTFWELKFPKRPPRLQGFLPEVGLWALMKQSGWLGAR